MRRLIGINARMLDQHFAGVTIRGHGSKGLERKVRCEHSGQLSAVYANVDVPGASHLKFLKTRKRPDPADNLIGNLARRLAKFLGELERKRQGVLAKFHFRRLFVDYVRYFQVVGTSQKFAQMLDQPAFQISIQGCPLSYWRNSDSNKLTA